MAKSITHALVGIAVLESGVDIDAPLKTVKNPDPKLSLRALLNLTDGLDWHEAAYDLVKSDATQMLFGRGRLDGAAYTAAIRQAVPPLTRFNYSTGAFQLAAAELQTRLFPDAITPNARRAAMAAWIRDRLFAPIGMNGAVAEFDPAGTFYGGSLVYASARDFARFGELYRRDGDWNGRRVLPAGWVTFARTPTVYPNYGAGFWLDPGVGSAENRIFGGAASPKDAFAAEGHSGQMILIVPSKALVIVRLALAPDGKASWLALGQWLAPIVGAFPDMPAVR
jgi:CubicO group peptidase (beta-lactamase class C family)